MLLVDEADDRRVRLTPTERAGDTLTMDARVTDRERGWTLSAPALSADEASELAAWLVGLAADDTGTGEWTALTFTESVLSLSGRRIPAGTVELRLAVLGMRADDATAPDASTDVVIGLRVTTAAATHAGAELMREVSALQR